MPVPSRHTRTVTTDLHIGIVGLGLIGGSLARALAQRRPQWQRWACDPDAASLAAACEAGVLHRAVPSLAALLDACDLVVLCQPVQALLGDLQALRSVCGQRLPVLTDVASVKAPVLAAAAAGLGAQRGRFVAGHPVAGRAACGWAAAEAGLFEGCQVVLCPEGADADALAGVAQLWQAVGARTLQMGAARHDAVFADISHLPQLLTWAYLQAVGSRPGWPEAQALAGPGFASFTRLATSSPALWAEIALHNRAALLRGIDGLAAPLHALREALQQADGPALQHLFDTARAMVAPPSNRPGGNP